MHILNHTFCYIARTFVRQNSTNNTALLVVLAMQQLELFDFYCSARSVSVYVTAFLMQLLNLLLAKDLLFG